MSGSATRRVLAAAAVSLAFAVSASPALADGDPASDYLLSQSSFIPFDTKMSKELQLELAAVVREANRSGYRVRLAVIATPYDLGAVTSLWRKPQRYAQFLAQELSFVYRNRLLIVMPNGFGFYRLGHPIVKERRVLAGLSVSAGGNGLARSAITAVKQLAASGGVKVVVRPAASPSSRNTQDRYLILAVVAGVLLALIIFVPRRRRPQTNS